MLARLAGAMVSADARSVGGMGETRFEQALEGSAGQQFPNLLAQLIECLLYGPASSSACEG